MLDAIPAVIHEVLSKCDRPSFRSAMRPLFVHALDRLRAVGTNGKLGPDPSAMIEVQEGFGIIPGLTEVQTRAEAAVELRESMGDGEGCRWFKCLLYERKHKDVMLLRCSGCRKSMYCSLNWQER